MDPLANGSLVTPLAYAGIGKGAGISRIRPNGTAPICQDRIIREFAC